MGKKKDTPADAVREYLASIGEKGGKAGGKRKRRGDADYYRQLVAKRKDRSPKD